MMPYNRTIPRKGEDVLKDLTIVGAAAALAKKKANAATAWPVASFVTS